MSKKREKVVGQFAWALTMSGDKVISAFVSTNKKYMQAWARQFCRMNKHGVRFGVRRFEICTDHKCITRKPTRKANK